MDTKDKSVTSNAKDQSSSSKKGLIHTSSYNPV